MSKKILCLVLAVCLCMSLGMSAFASSGEASGDASGESSAAAGFITVEAGATSRNDEGFVLDNAGNALAVADDTHLENAVITADNSGSAAAVLVTGGEYTIGGEADNVQCSFPTFDALGGTVTDFYNTSIVLTDSGSGFAANCTGGVLNINNAYLEVAGQRRMAVGAHKQAVVVINDSAVISYGGPTEGGDGGSMDTNKKLLVGGVTRSNFSEGASTTYYFNSYCVTDGWAAMSTDSATSPGLWFYSYNSVGVSYWGGYGTYADTSCHDYFYASKLYGEDMAVIISNDGEVYALPGSDADAEVLAYNTGATSDAGSEFWGGRNCFEIHAPNMNHASNQPGSASGQRVSTVVIKDSTVGVDKAYENTTDELDFGAAYGEPYTDFVNFIDGAVFLVKSTCTNITLDNATVVSPNGIIYMSVINNDDTPYTIASGDVAEGKLDTLTMSNGSYEGDVLDYDYMRYTQIELVNADWTGMAETWDYDTWQARWEKWADDEVCTWYIPDFAGYESLGTKLHVAADSVWNAVGESQLCELVVDAGGVVNGTVTVNGAVVDVTAGGSWSGDIVVTGEAAAAAADSGDLSITFNGAEYGVFSLDGTAGDNGFQFNLAALLNAFGITINYDEATGTLTVDPGEGLLGQLLGTLLGGFAAQTETAPAEEAAPAAEPASEEPASAEPAGSEEPASGEPAASGEAGGDMFALYIDYMKGQLIEDGEFYDEFLNTLNTVTEATYDETGMPFEMFITNGALGYEAFCEYYAANGAAPSAAVFGE